MDKYDLSGNLKTLDNKDIQEGSKAKILANTLASSTKLNPLKAWNWATSLHANGFLEIDDVDLGVLKGFIEENDSLVNLAKAQILQSFDKPEEKKKGK